MSCENEVGAAAVARSIVSTGSRVPLFALGEEASVLSTLSGSQL